MNPPRNSPLHQLPVILNGVLMSYKLPGKSNIRIFNEKISVSLAFDKSDPAKSVTALVNKGLKLFTSYKLDVGPFIHQTYTGVVEGVGRHVSEEEYNTLMLDQKIDLVSAIIESEVVMPCLKVHL